MISLHYVFDVTCVKNVRAYMTFIRRISLEIFYSEKIQTQQTSSGV